MPCLLTAVAIKEDKAFPGIDLDKDKRLTVRSVSEKEMTRKKR